MESTEFFGLTGLDDYDIFSCRALSITIGGVALGSQNDNRIIHCVPGERKFVWDCEAYAVDVNWDNIGFLNISSFNDQANVELELLIPVGTNEVSSRFHSLELDADEFRTFRYDLEELYPEAAVVLNRERGYDIAEECKLPFDNNFLEDVADLDDYGTSLQYLFSEIEPANIEELPPIPKDFTSQDLDGYILSGSDEAD